MLAEVDPAELPMPRARGRALVGLCRRTGRRRRPRWTAAPTGPTYAPGCWPLPGIGPWTADYVAMRALGDPDVFLPTDVGVRRALVGSGCDVTRLARGR